MNVQKVVWVVRTTDCTWMYDESVYSIVFVGDIAPSDEKIRAVLEFQNVDNGQDGADSQDVSIKVYEGMSVVDFQQKHNDESTTVVDVANKRFGVADMDGEIEWGAEDAWGNAQAFIEGE